MGRESKLTSEAYLRKARQEITAWEGAKRSYLSRISDAVFSPAAKLTAKVVPRSVQNAASGAIEKSLLLTAQAGEFSVDIKAIARERTKLLGRKRALGTRLQACDGLARRFWTTHCGYAAAQGAATGVAGFAGFVADIPLILSIAIRAIRTIGLCYGYNTTRPEEIDYVLHVLRTGSSSELNVRAESLQALKTLEQSILRDASNENRSEEGKKSPDRVKYLMTIQQYAKSLGIDLVRRNALQLVPLAGAVTGASFNAAYANDVGRAAYMCYRRRFILEGVLSLKGQIETWVK